MVNQYGNRSVYIGEVNGNVYMNSSDNSLDYRQIFRYISTDLRSWRSFVYADKHIPRKQTDELCQWIDNEHHKEKERVALLVGAPGSGKSVVMHDILQVMEERTEVYVLGLKSDQIGCETIDNLAKENGISSKLEEVIHGMAQEAEIKRIVLLVDQIDALSLSLSSNRKPLRSILRFIENIQNNPKVRVIISCRPYDLEYDPFLEQFQFGVKVKMDPLKVEVVEEVLRVNNRNTVPQASNLFNTLRIPLYLYLFLKLKPNDNLDTALSEHGLYNCLWNQVINNGPEINSDRVDHQRLLLLLDLITGRMYENQSLTLSSFGINSSFAYELEYLLHEEILIKVSDERIQFFHQSLFDYVYARRFVERGDNLLDALTDRHQGLFIRALVKSVLTFLRESSIEGYIESIRHILFDKKEDGADAYRFHLKMLVISMMGYTTNLRPAEIRFVREELVTNNNLLELFIKSIRSKEWFIAIQTIIDHSLGWRGMNENDCLLMLGICSQLIHIEQYLVLSYFEKYLPENVSEKIRDRVVTTLNYFNPEKDNLFIVQTLYHKIITDDADTSLVNLLSNLGDSDPDFVLKCLRRIVSYAIKSNKDNGRIKDINIHHGVEHIYDKLYKRYPDRVFNEFLSIVQEICDASKLDYKINDGLTMCSVYTMYQPITNPYIGYKFAEDILSIVIKEVELRAKDERVGIVDIVLELNQSKYDIIRVVSACAFIANPKLFKEPILALLTDIWLLSNCSGLLKYYYRQLLASAFSLYSYEEQQGILNAIMNSAHDYEKNYVRKEHLKWGVCVSLIDELKYEYLSDISDEILKENFHDIYKKKHEYMRKFGKRENEMPHRVTTHVGWTGLDLETEKANKLTSDEWLSAMRKYKSDHTISFDAPTMTGIAHQFEAAVTNNPGKYHQTIVSALNDSDIPMAYSYAGLKGLITAKYDSNAIEELYINMIGKLNPVINENSVADLIGLIRQADYFIENLEKLRREILDFLILVVREYNDRYDDRAEDELEREPYQSGINEVRGVACENLVECYRFPEYTEEIFSAFEDIAENATIHTRSAILFKMALLNNLSPERSLDLFFKLMYDYRPNMMALPLHNLNPLVYYINYGFPKLMGYFEKCIETPMCHEQMAPLLWLAYAKGMEGAEGLLTRMLEASDAAKAALINYFATSKKIVISQALIIPWVIKCLQISNVEQDLARAYDNIFDGMMEGWPADVKEEIIAYYADGGWVDYAHHDYIRYIASMAISDPANCLKWLNRTLSVSAKIISDSFFSSKIIEILLQAYNGLTEFSAKTPDLEFAMDLLDQILMERKHDVRLDMFLDKLDNA